MRSSTYISFTKMKWRILQKIFIIEDYVIDDATEHTYSTTHSTDYFTPIHNDFDFDASNDWELSLDYYQSNRGGGVGLNPVNQGNTIKYHIILVWSDLFCLWKYHHIKYNLEYRIFFVESFTSSL